MAKRKLSGPGRLGSAKAVSKSLESRGDSSIRTVPAEESIVVRFLDEPEDWHGYFEHWLSDGPVPCATDDCDGCNSDEDEERRKSFRYIANVYSVDDQKVIALKMPKTLAEMLMNFYQKYKGTLRDRDYELSRTGKGMMDTKYMAAPEDPTRMKLERFESKKFDLEELLISLLDDDDDDGDDDGGDMPVRSSRKPWDDDDDDDDDDDYTPRRKATRKKRVVAKNRRR